MLPKQITRKYDSSVPPDHFRKPGRSLGNMSSLSGVSSSYKSQHIIERHTCGMNKKGHILATSR